MKPCCPYCTHINCIPEVLYSNVENYGDNSFDVPCTKCGRMIRVYARRTVVINQIDKSNAKNSDF